MTAQTREAEINPLMPGGGLPGELLPLGLNVGFKSKGFGYGDEDPRAIIRDVLHPNVPAS